MCLQSVGAGRVAAGCLWQAFALTALSSACPERVLFRAMTAAAFHCSLRPVCALLCLAPKTHANRGSSQLWSSAAC